MSELAQMAARYPELAGKVALVTGGSRGIGEATVRALAAAGAAVVFNYKASAERAERIVAELGAERALAVRCDLADPLAVERLWQEAVAWRGGLDVLVNNASVREPVPLEGTPTADWDAHWIEALRVNLVAPAHLSRLAIPGFRARGGGVIVSLSGRIAVRGDYPDYLHDGAAKGGLNSLMRGIARGFAAENVLAYILCGGIIDTDQFRAQQRANGGDDRFLREIPMGEYGRPEELAEQIVHLATGRVRYSTGSTIDAVGASFLH